MRATVFLAALLLLAACTQHTHQPTTIKLTYRQPDIQKHFDTLYQKEQITPGLYTGFIEQASAVCHGTGAQKADSFTQDVFSSMYYNKNSGNYDCVTTTTFQFPDGNIAAAGVFNLKPGDTIAPDHDFPITGGSAAYRNIFGTYTRQYRDGIYHVELRYYKLN